MNTQDFSRRAHDDARSGAGCPPSLDEFRFVDGLVRGMRCGIIVIDSTGRLRLINEHARQILDLQALPERGVTLELGLAQHPQLARLLRESFEMTSLPNRAEIDLESSTGGSKTIGFTLSLVRDERDEIRGAAIFFKDLTHIEQHAEQERLRDRLVVLGEMAASMAHEIRNPLAAIGISCSLLERRLGQDDRAAQLLSKIAAEVRRIERTVNSSLEFVRPVCPSLGAAALEPLLREALSVAVQRHPAAGIDVRYQLDSDLDPFLMDRDLLREVFVNIIVNALEAMGDNGVLTLSSERVPAPREASVPYLPASRRGHDPWRNVDHFVLVRIADTGPGVAPEALQRIFYPFFTTKRQGSGVGLSTARKIVLSHRGLIDVDMPPTGGAVFTVRLPMVATAAEVMTP